MIGNTIKLAPDGKIKMPPPINPAKPTELYDSIQGNTGGSDVFMIYTNKQAYPEYLISYK